VISGPEAMQEEVDPPPAEPHSLRQEPASLPLGTGSGSRRDASTRADHAVPGHTRLLGIGERAERPTDCPGSAGHPQ
jgi:hypothetical protein